MPRPPRNYSSSSARERERFKFDLLVLHEVYVAVLEGQAYKDDALLRGQKFAQEHGIELTLDGVDALVKRIVKQSRSDPEILLTGSPAEVRDAIAASAAGWQPDKSLRIPIGGRKTKLFTHEPYLPDDDRPSAVDYPTLRVTVKKK